METQLHRPQDTGLHSGEGHGQIHDEGEHHHKQSVLKKVKAKAKKIKDHLKHGLGHDHGHEHEHEHEQYSLQGDEEETDDEEMEEGAAVHGGPYAIRSKDIPKEEVVPMGNLENPTSPKEDRYDSKMKNEDVHRPILQRQDEFARPPSLEGTHFPEERHKPVFTGTHETTKGIDDDHVTALGKHEHQGLQGHENTGAPMGLTDHHAAHRPVSAAETKGFDHVTAPGAQGHQGLQGHENIIGAPTGLVDHHAASVHRPITTAAETHETTGFDHHVTAPGSQGNQGLQGTENIIGAAIGLANPHASHLHEQMHRPPVVTDTGARGELNDQGLQGHKFKVLTGLEEDPNVPKDYPNLTNYQSKVTDPTGANNEEAGVSPLVQSFEKMGVNDVPETTRIRTEPKAGDFQFDQGTEHSQYTGSHDQFAPQESPTVFPSVRENTESIPKSINPSNPEDLPEDTLTGKPGSYTEKFSSATSAIADKAVAAKNIVASKLGYGGTEEETRKAPTEGNTDATKTTSATEFAQKAVSTVAGKLAPVYDKVAGAGSTVMAKVTGHENRGGVDAEHEVKTDKGVSMTEYLAEKFKPGEEDRALSEVISGSLSRQKEKTGEAKPMGKVTESVEVERRLGPIEPTKKEEEVGASGETKVGENFGQGVMDRVKGAVSTWLGKGVEAQANDSATGGGAVVGGRG